LLALRYPEEATVWPVVTIVVERVDWAMIVGVARPTTTRRSRQKNFMESNFRL